MWCSRRVLLAAGLIAGLTGCGFRPMMGGPGDGPVVRAGLARTAVAPIADRMGQMLRIGLVDRLNPSGTPDKPLYRLEVTLDRRTDEQAFRTDDTATRARLHVTANWALSDDKKVVTNGQVRAVVPYDIMEARYATVSAQRDAEALAARQLAEEIRTRLALFFERADPR
ncbi:MAG: hypothetical protein HQL38_07645 [Alphaproteobacteria bacterium]|nr:hypothetical protein [Alphaproteobacteria bacterium]MBF0392539.1 hypothetical protein [Alphaproteobacteria bacterium]